MDEVVIKGEDISIAHAIMMGSTIQKNTDLDKQVKVIIVGDGGLSKETIETLRASAYNTHSTVLIVDNSTKSELVAPKREPFELKVIKHIAFDNPKKVKGHQRPYKYHR
jgi:translation elongation factor EF-Tu-like GTPase